MATVLDHPVTSTRPRELARVVEFDPARLGGVPVFRGTRVPVKGLFDHLHAGDSLETFLADFPGVTRDQALAVLDLAAQQFLGGVRPVRVLLEKFGA